MTGVLERVIRSLEKAHNDWAKQESERLALTNRPSPAQRAKTKSKR